MLRKPTGEHKREAVVVYNPENNSNTATTTSTLTRKKRVAAYARVSTEQDEQQNSFEAQIEFYTGYIQGKPEWEFVGIYADDGITGTNMKRRDEFNRMVDDAMHGKIDLILTKSISRFSRNTLDALTITRQLTSAGVEVFFEKENLSSTDPRAEMIFTIMCTVAQEESRSISENVRWGKQRSMEAGKISLAYKSFLGYEKGPDGLPRIVEEEAEIVRSIYQWYLDGMNFSQIADRLTERGVQTPSRRSDVWSATTVRSILMNEKYKGDARLQKTYTVDFLTKEVRVNQGERKQWYIRDSHDAIVSPETFELVQQEIKRRTARKGKFFDSPFTGKIVCGDCGAYYGHRVWHSNTRYRRNIWLCNEKYSNGNKCCPPRVTDDELEQAFIVAANQMLVNKAEYIDSYEKRILPLMINAAPLEERKESLKAEMLKLNTEAERLIHDNATRPQDQAEYTRRFDELTQALEQKEAEISSLEKEIAELYATKKQVEIFLKALRQFDEDCITTFQVSTWHAFVDYAEIMPDKSIVFHMRDGSTISVPLERTERRK